METNKRKLQRATIKLNKKGTTAKKKELHGNLRFDALLEDGGKNICGVPLGIVPQNL